MENDINKLVLANSPTKAPNFATFLQPLNYHDVLHRQLYSTNNITVTQNFYPNRSHKPPADLTVRGHREWTKQIPD